MSNKIKFLLATLLITLVTIMGQGVFASEINFKDIKDHWAEDVITEWKDKEVINGYNDKYNPDANITRADLAVIIQRLMKYNSKSENNFKDLKDDYYTDSVLSLNAAKIMLGDGETVRPTDNITREESIVMLARAFAIEKLNNAENKFADEEEISDWAKELVDGMKKEGYVQGRGENKLCAKENITRAEAIKIIDNMVELYANKEGEYEADVDGIVLVNAKGVILKNMRVKKIIVSDSLTENAVELKNVIADEIIVKEGKETTVKTQKDETLEVTAQDFGTLANSQYRGLSVGFSIGNYKITDVKGMKVQLYAGDELLATNTAKMDAWKTYELTNGQCSSPFIVKEGNFKATDDEAWNHGAIVANAAKVPTKAVITVYDKFGYAHKVEATTFAQHIEWTKLFEDVEVIDLKAENFNTHKGLDYQGLNVGFSIGEGSNISYVDSMKVELYSDDALLATNEAKMEKMKEITSGEFSTPFIIKAGTYTVASEEYWTMNILNAKKGTIATKAVITVKDIYGKEYKVENENLIEADGIKWENLLETPDLVHVEAENFNTNKDKNYIGLNVGFNTKDTNFAYISKMKVDLYAKDTEGKDVLLATNEAKMEKMKEVGGNQFSTPFIIKAGIYKEEYWTMTSVKTDKNLIPSKAVITITDMFGKEYKAQNENLVMLDESYEKLITETPVIAELAAENFNTHYDGNYAGINVGFDLKETDMNTIKSIKVNLYDGSKILAINEAVMEEMKKITGGKFSTPFIVKEGTYKKADDAYWKFGEIMSDKAISDIVISKAEIIVTDIYGKEYKAENENLVKAAGTFEEICGNKKFLQIAAENFNTHKGTDYAGINVGFNIGNGSNIAYIKNMRVELYSDEKLVAANDAIMEKMEEITTGKFSTPFIIKEGSYTRESEEYWVMSETTLSKGTIATKAKIIIEDIYGTKYEIENDNLQKAMPTWDELYEVEEK